MDALSLPTGWKRVYALWHIPSSTLLASTLLIDEICQQFRRVLTDGCLVDDLMLQVKDEGQLVGRQHLGASIAEALQLGEEPCGEEPGAS